jgi:hypothetical protein
MRPDFSEYTPVKMNMRPFKLDKNEISPAFMDRLLAVSVANRGSADEAKIFQKTSLTATTTMYSCIGIR